MDASLTPNNTETKWINNMYSSSNGVGHCKHTCTLWVESPSVAKASYMKAASTDSDETITIDLRTGTANHTAYVECSTPYGLNAPVKIQTNKFYLWICAKSTFPTTST